jgi:hypothetical protein
MLACQNIDVQSESIARIYNRRAVSERSFRIAYWKEEAESSYMVKGAKETGGSTS